MYLMMVISQQQCKSAAITENVSYDGYKSAKCKSAAITENVSYNGYKSAAM